MEDSTHQNAFCSQKLIVHSIFFGAPGMSFISPEVSTSVTNKILVFVDGASGGVNTLGMWTHDGTKSHELEKYYKI